MALPVFASIMLGSLYLAFKYLDASYLNMLLRAYFCVIGAVCLSGFLEPLFARVLPNTRPVIDIAKLPLLGQPLQLTQAGIAGLLAGACLAAWYGLTRHWLANNLLGIGFCIQGMQSVALGSFTNGALLLSGLFVYDIVMVFKTTWMVSVATQVDGPIKLLFPRGVQLLTADGSTRQAMSMLGLGDIVVPGIFLALLLRFDYSRHLAAAGKRDEDGDAGGGGSAALWQVPFAKPFFSSGLVAYTLGLVATVVVMVEFDAAQPALLYLVPAVLLTAVGTALARGDMKALLAYHDEADAGAGAEAGAAASTAATTTAAGHTGGDGSAAATDGPASSASVGDAAGSGDADGSGSGAGSSSGGGRSRQRRRA
jgi:minor histocompatibility antigen H13